MSNFPPPHAANRTPPAFRPPLTLVADNRPKHANGIGSIWWESFFHGWLNQCSSAAAAPFSGQPGASAVAPRIRSKRRMGRHQSRNGTLVTGAGGDSSAATLATARWWPGRHSVRGLLLRVNRAPTRDCGFSLEYVDRGFAADRPPPLDRARMKGVNAGVFSRSSRLTACWAKRTRHTHDSIQRRRNKKSFLTPLSRRPPGYEQVDLHNQHVQPSPVDRPQHPEGIHRPHRGQKKGK